MFNTALCYDKLGKKEDCMRALNRSLKYKPNYAKALVKRGDLNIELEQFNEAIRDYSEAQEHDPSGFNVAAKLKDAQSKAKKAKRKDYYKILGVSKDAQEPEI